MVRDPVTHVKRVHGCLGIFRWTPPAYAVRQEISAAWYLQQRFEIPSGGCLWEILTPASAPLAVSTSNIQHPRASTSGSTASYVYKGPDTIEWCPSAVHHATVFVGAWRTLLSVYAEREGLDSANVFTHMQKEIQSNSAYTGGHAVERTSVVVACIVVGPDKYKYLVSSITVCTFAIVVELCGPQRLPLGVASSTSVPQSRDKTG